MFRFLFIVLGLLSLFLVSCEKDNFDVTEEIPNQISPVVIDTEEENFLFLVMPDGDTINFNGMVLDADGTYGLITEPESESYISCGEDGGIRIDGSMPRDTSLYMVITSNSPSSDPFLFVAGGVKVEGFEQEYAFASAVCGHSTVMDITSLTDDRISGSYTGDFYVSENLSCEGTLLNVGEIKVAFNLPLTPCE